MRVNKGFQQRGVQEATDKRSADALDLSRSNLRPFRLVVRLSWHDRLCFRPVKDPWLACAAAAKSITIVVGHIEVEPIESSQAEIFELGLRQLACERPVLRLLRKRLLRGRARVEEGLCKRPRRWLV